MRKRNYSDRFAVAAKQRREEENYWLKRLSGELRKSSFPFDNSSIGVSRGKFSSIRFQFPDELFIRINKITNDSDVRLNILLVAGLMILLDRYSDMEDIIIGIPIYKQETDVDFINTVLPIRKIIKANETFKDFIMELGEVIFEAIKYQNYPMERILYQLNMSTLDNNDFPLFDVALLLKNVHQREYLQHINLNMIFSFERTESGIKGILEFNSSLYEQLTIERIIVHFQHLLFDALDNVSKEVHSLEILSVEEYDSILNTFCSPEESFWEDNNVQGLFEEQIRKKSDRVAVVFENNLLSYKELNERAERLASLLIYQGVKPSDIVGIMLDRSMDMIIGILGILKSGGAYMPLDPVIPIKRLHFMLKDSGTGLILIQKVFAERMRNEFQTLDVEDVVFHEGKYLKLDPQKGSNNPAYVIYTSGSTGKPKGVLIEHSSVINLALSQKEEFKTNSEDRILQFSSISFDASVEQIFVSFYSGSTLIIVSKMLLLDMAKFGDFIERNAITHIHTVPIFLSKIEVKHYSSLKRVIAGGDTCPAYLARRWSEVCDFYNEYGPTETTVTSIEYLVREGNGLIKNLPIGRPIKNTSVFVLDRLMRLVPIGVPGELYIGGEGVSWGYLNKPELTAERFVSVYFNKSEKFYKTGDLSRWLPDGNIEFLGRIDNQVKIKGYRIELGEIENWLLEHNQIDDVVVMAREDAAGEKCLCAYVVLNSELGVSELREYLTDILPDYMIPSRYISLKKLPLTSNGKIDRKSLHSEEGIDLEAGSNYVAPRNTIEEKLTTIWQQVLGRDQVGINENFFMIGGDSIKSIQIAARMNKAGYKIDMKDIFQNQTIAQLAPKVKKLERIADQSIITGKVPLTAIQVAFFESHKQDRHHFNQSVMLYSEEGFDKDMIEAVFMKIQEHHDALRMTFKEENGKIIQINNPIDYPFSLKEYDLSDNYNADVEFRAKIDEIQSTIDLERGPLMKLGLFHLEDGDRLLIVIHHLVVDGVSWRILLEDVETLCQLYLRGEPPRLPLKSDSFKLWSETLSRLANEEMFLSEKKYWSELESTEVLKIRKDFTEGNNDNSDKGSLSIHLMESMTEALLSRVHKPFTTEINDILITALGLAIKKSFGLTRILFALEGHGREEILEKLDLKRTVGWFTTVYPVILDISYASDLSRQIKEVKETLRRIPNKGIGYGVLNYLTDKKHKSESEFKFKPQIIFNYLGQIDEDIAQTSFSFAGEPTGDEESRKAIREYELEITGMIVREKLVISIDYNVKQYKLDTIKLLLKHYEEQLRDIIRHCEDQRKRELTPSDLIFKQLTIDDIEGVEKFFSRHTNQDIQDIYPLTPMQEGMFFHYLLDKSSSAYFTQISFQLRGSLNIDVVEKSLNELFKRYDILRTAFVYELLERPMQVVLKNRSADFYYKDLRYLADKGERKSFISEFKEKDWGRLFDLSTDRIMRISVFQHDDNTFEFLWSHHHILFDGWCQGILIEEFFEIYFDYIQDRKPQLAEPKRYRTYIEWLERQNKNLSREYWKNYLHDYEGAVSIPNKKTNHIDKTGFIREQILITLNIEKTIELKRLASINHVTLNTILQAVWGILLGKYNGKQDVAFISVVSGRPSNLEGVELMVGLFINSVPIRVKYRENTRFIDLLQEIQEGMVTSEPHHYFPLADIQAASHLKKELFDHIFAFENYPVSRQIEGMGKNVEGRNTSVRLVPSSIEIFEQTNYDFTLVCAPGDQINVYFKYNGNVFDPGSIKKISLHYEEVLDQIIEDHNIQINDIKISHTLLAAKSDFSHNEREDFRL